MARYKSDPFKYLKMNVHICCCRPLRSSGRSRHSDKAGGGGGRGVGGHPNPEIREMPGLQKNFFQSGLKIRGGGPPGPLP